MIIIAVSDPLSSVHYPLPNFIEWLQNHEICEQYLEYLGHVISTSTKNTKKSTQLLPGNSTAGKFGDTACGKACMQILTRITSVIHDCKCNCEHKEYVRNTIYCAHSNKYDIYSITLYRISMQSGRGRSRSRSRGSGRGRGISARDEKVRADPGCQSWNGYRQPFQIFDRASTEHRTPKKPPLQCQISDI